MRSSRPLGGIWKTHEIIQTGERAFDELLSHVRYQLDPAWAAYFRAADLNAAEREAVLRASLSTTAFDATLPQRHGDPSGARHGRIATTLVPAPTDLITRTASLIT